MELEELRPPLGRKEFPPAHHSVGDFVVVVVEGHEDGRVDVEDARPCPPTVPSSPAGPGSGDGRPGG